MVAFLEQIMLESVLSHWRNLHCNIRDTHSASIVKVLTYDKSRVKNDPLGKEVRKTPADTRSSQESSRKAALVIRERLTMAMAVLKKETGRWLLGRFYHFLDRLAQSISKGGPH